MSKRSLMRVLIVAVVSILVVAAAADAQATREEPRIALVIGNSSYREVPLRNPVNDVRAMVIRMALLLVGLVGSFASGWVPAIVTVVAPFAMTYFLAYATGAKPLERTMMQRPGYPEYAERTSMFVPRPPRRS